MERVYMKGKSPFNKPSVRKTDTYKLLMKLGGEARWRDLKANLKELGWGPTTLKQTLDEMVREGIVVKEAKLGQKGPEVWYKAKIKEEDIWGPFEKPFGKGETSINQLTQAIRTQAQTLRGEERELFLKRQMRKVAEIARDTLLAPLYIIVRGAYHKSERKELLTIFDYIYEAILKENMRQYAEILMDYPEHSMKALLELLITEESEREETLKTEGLRK
jgi:DNA-binding HxlR family transcriptional regulator